MAFRMLLTVFLPETYSGRATSRDPRRPDSQGLQARQGDRHAGRGVQEGNIWHICFRVVTELLDRTVPPLPMGININQGNATFRCQASRR